MSAVRFSCTEKLYRYFIIDHNQPKSIQTNTKSKQNQSNKTKTKTMISMAQMENLFQLMQKYNKKIHTWLEISEKLNFKNYTKWCKEI